MYKVLVQNCWTAIKNISMEAIIMFSLRVFLSIFITLSILFKSTIGLALAQTPAGGCPTTLYGSVSYTAPVPVTPPPTIPPPVIPPQVCGNMILEVPEQCDDGNILSGDGCSATCLLEGRPPLAFPLQVCGNMILEAPEQCDDGNIVGMDGCSSACTVEMPPPIIPVCGNMILEAPEQCDDGNIFSGDGCSSTCTVEIPPPVYNNDFDNDGVNNSVDNCPSVYNPDQADSNLNGVGNVCDTVSSNHQCGNHVTESPMEQCDDGNTIDGDGCSCTCQIE